MEGGRSNLYGRRWVSERRRFLEAHRTCECSQPSTVVITDPADFWNQAKWRAACAECLKKARLGAGSAPGPRPRGKVS